MVGYGRRGAIFPVKYPVRECLVGLGLDGRSRSRRLGDHKQSATAPNASNVTPAAENEERRDSAALLAGLSVSTLQTLHVQTDSPILRRRPPLRDLHRQHRDEPVDRRLPVLRNAQVVVDPVARRVEQAALVLHVRLVRVSVVRRRAGVRRPIGEGGGVDGGAGDVADDLVTEGRGERKYVVGGRGDLGRGDAPSNIVPVDDDVMVLLRRFLVGRCEEIGPAVLIRAVLDPVTEVVAAVDGLLARPEVRVTIVPA